jgi:integrase
MSAAKEIAQNIWDRAVSNQENPGRIETIGELVSRYSAVIENIYPETSNQPEDIKRSIALLDEMSEMLLDEFGPVKFRQVRQKLIDKGSLSARTINLRMTQIRGMFEWAVGYEIVHPHIPYALKQVKNLSQTSPIPGVKASKKRETVSLELVSRTIQQLTPTLGLMVQVQLLSGMRPNEVCLMRPCDIDMSGEIWLYKPAEHKTKYKGHDRVVALSAAVQDLISERVSRREPEEYVFKPSDSVHEAKKLKQDSRSRKNDGDRYIASSYRRAVTRACKRVFEQAQKDNPESELKIEDFKWTPYQLRHTAATILRAELGDEGLSAVQALLGQKSYDVAEHYARVNQDLAKKAANVLEKIKSNI